jgi:RHS repeat-associated protein
MVGNTVETTTTYEPYGKVLAQTGETGTVYGYTGEQYDALTNLVYLRARYYNPSLKLFLSRDPFPGIPTMPASQHGYSYSHNNPVNLTDPSGQTPIVLVVGGLVIVTAVLYVAIDAIIDAGPAMGELVGDLLLPSSSPQVALPLVACQTTVVIAENAFEEFVNSDEFRPAPKPEREPIPIPWPFGHDLFDTKSYEMFYRFVPTSEALSVVAGQYNKLWVPSNMLSQENFVSQDFNYVNHLAALTAARKGTSMTVLQIATIPGTFDYLTNPNNARLHDGISGSYKNLDWLAGQVNHDVGLYQTFVSGDGTNYLQLKKEGETLTMGFFRAYTHRHYFERQIEYVEAVSVH